AFSRVIPSLFPGDTQPFPKATAGYRGSAVPGESPGAASPLHSQPSSLQTQKRKNLPLCSALGRGCDDGGEGGRAGA
ncbi:hypothetical protein Nmel_018560, partial [Mimus melanotis]